MRFTKYNLSSGKITSNVFTQNIDQRINEGEGYVEGWYSPDEYQIQDGIPIQISVEVVDVTDQPRLTRNQRLSDTDWTQVSDSPLSEEKKLEYQAYRQELRDLPNHANWPNLNDEDWPVMP